MRRAAENGHAYCLDALIAAGAKIEQIHLSLCKGSGVLALVQVAINQAGVPGADERLQYSCAK
jgi:hypothetical protein